MKLKLFLMGLFVIGTICFSQFLLVHLETKSLRLIVYIVTGGLLGMLISIMVTKFILLKKK